MIDMQAIRDIVAQSHFCNIHRRDDRTSRFVRDRIVLPNRDDPDLFLKIITFRCFNERTAGETIDWRRPFDLDYIYGTLKAHQAAGGKVFRTAAYKMPLPKEVRGNSALQCLFEIVLPPIAARRDELRPRVGDSLDDVQARFLSCYGIGEFYSNQFLADLKQVGPLASASDRDTFMTNGQPGSDRGLNRSCDLPLKHKWSLGSFRATAEPMRQAFNAKLIAAGIAPVDGQDFTHCLCEGDKMWRIIETGKIPRKYKATKAPLPGQSEAATASEPKASGSVPDYILADIETVTPARKSGLKASQHQDASPAVSPSASSEPASPPKTVSPLPPALPSQPSVSPSLLRRHNSIGHKHGDSGPPRGEVKAAWIYDHPDQPLYLLVQKRIDANGDRQFLQHHWTGRQWQLGVKGSYAERKVPYQLCALKAALQADPNVTVHVAEGEKDADTLRSHGYVATTNPGGAPHWSDDCTAWLRVLGVRTIVVHEDNDDAGRARSVRLAAALSGFADVRIATYEDAPEGEDVTWWIENGHTKGDLDARIAAAKPATGAELEEWDAGELLSGALPAPRQWLIGGTFCRTFLSGLVAPGDVGKTTLRLTQAIELATGRELLGMRVYQRSKVLVLSFEDDRPELHRRLLAICRHHNISSAELKGWLFCKDLNGGAKLAELDARGRKRQIGALDGMLRRAIARTGCSLVVLDPFVKLHALNESDNADMDFLCSALIRIAQNCGIAIDSPAHTHKGQIQAGDADARRGASAQRDAGRLDYTLTAMSEDEAKQFGINLDVRKGYMRLDKAKANIVRAVKARWFRLVSVRLANADSVYVEGDEVQAIERWAPPEVWADAAPETLNAILDAIDAGLPDGRRYSDHSKAKGREAWLLVESHCPGKGEAQCREMIRQWLKAGVLVEKDYDDPTARKPRKGLFLDPGKRPHY
jgi:hypothetical protein